jgi:hypothetical protein
MFPVFLRVHAHNPTPFFITAVLPACRVCTPAAAAACVLQVAVLDEVQMLGDRGRGWSWTRVLLGLPASQLHLCGDPAAAGLLEQLAAECGDTLDIKRYRCVGGGVIQGWVVLVCRRAKSTAAVPAP